MRTLLRVLTGGAVRRLAMICAVAFMAAVGCGTVFAAKGAGPNDSNPAGTKVGTVPDQPPKSLSPQIPKSLWDLARSKAEVHRFSTLMTAQDVRDRLSTRGGHRRGHRLVQARRA